MLAVPIASILAQPTTTEQQPLFEVLQRVQLNFKDSMIKKGFFFNFPENDFTFVIQPNGLKFPTRVDSKKISSEGVSFPTGTTLVGNQLYEYEIYDPMAYNHKFPLEFTFRGEDFTGMKLYYYDFSLQDWLEFPHQELQDTELVGYAYATKLRMAILRDDANNHGMASWYAYKDCDCAASPFYPKGTRILVTQVYDGDQIVVTVNDFGPELDKHPDRVIDLDKTAFEKIAPLGAGVIEVTTQVVDEAFSLPTQEISNEGSNSVE